MHAETPRLADKTIVFSEHEVFKVSCHGNTIILLRIFLQMKNLLKYHFYLQNYQFAKHIYVSR